LQCEEHGRTIVIVPNKSLVTQTEDDYRNLGLDVGVYYGKRKEFGHKHTICTWQSLNILQKKAEAATENATVASLRDPTNVTINDFLEDVICVIVDEVHAAKADALRNLLTGSMSKLPIRWGLTGTVPKDDCFRISLICSIGSVTNKLSARELQDMDVLSDCHIHVRQLMDHKAYQNYQDELRYLLEDKKRMEYIGEMIGKIAAGGNTLVLIDRVKPGKDLVGMIDEAVFVFGNTKDTTRKEHYDDVATASNKVIVATYGVAAVGINLPRIFNLVLIEPGKSFVRVIQSIGRGIRKAEDKDHVDIYDITSNCKFAKRHLTTRKKFYREAEYEFSIEKIDWQK
jgi:superfamily II DNA or RNA helicase